MLDKEAVKEFYQGLLVCGDYSSTDLAREAKYEFRVIINRIKLVGGPKYDKVPIDLIRWAQQTIDERSPREKAAGRLTRTRWENFPDDVLTSVCELLDRVIDKRNSGN